MIRKTWTLDPVTYNILRTAARIEGFKSESSLMRKIVKDWTDKWNASDDSQTEEDED